MQRWLPGARQRVPPDQQRRQREVLHPEVHVRAKWAAELVKTSEREHGQLLPRFSYSPQVLAPLLLAPSPDRANHLRATDNHPRLVMCEPRSPLNLLSLALG